MVPGLNFLKKLEMIPRGVAQQSDRICQIFQTSQTRTAKTVIRIPLIAKIMLHSSLSTI